MASNVTPKMNKGQNTLSTWEYIKLIPKIELFDLLLEWTNGHCGYVELVEYFAFDYLYVFLSPCCLWLPPIYMRGGGKNQDTPPS